jgi:peptide-methionine (S)-S-oxide reductase
MSSPYTIQAAVFGGGCFWCTEAVFEMLKGVISVMPGYAGGDEENPIYDTVVSGRTGHAEVTKVEFDPQEISYTDLLTIFFAIHDPTTLNRQGADVGTQYRSIILYTDEDQKHKAEAFIKELDESSPATPPIVTEVEPLEAFYPAEDYHREYYRKNTSQPYCQIVINPKLEKIQARYAALLKTKTKN